MVLHRRDNVLIAPALPELPLDAWRATKDTLQLYAQIVGKLKLELAPPEPEWAHVTLAVTSRGLTTGPIPYHDRTFQVDFDFILHEVAVCASDGRTQRLKLEPRSVASFYEDVFALLESLDIVVHVNAMPQEVPDPISFEQDTVHASYDAEYANRFFRILVFVDTVFKAHRAPYRGRHTQVQFFWGGFDLAYTRYSGKPAPPPPGVGKMMQLAMDVEEIYAGFWAGDGRYPAPAFGAYIYPKPDGLERLPIGPAAAGWNEQVGLFLLPYEDVRTAGDPVAVLSKFLTTTFDTCATCARWELP